MSHATQVYPDTSVAHVQHQGSRPSYIIGPTPPITDYYTLGKTLGTGQYGAAYEAVSNSNGMDVAVKVINKSRFRSSDIAYQFDSMRSEIGIMRTVDHPNIIKLHDVFETENDLYLVMELCRGGELFDRIKERRQYSEKEAQDVLRQICEGVNVLHERKIAHCDLKPDNFLFVSKDPASPLKIIDFGMSKSLRRREYLKHLRGTPYYIAPEVLSGQYSECCDMWSIGVVMFVMLFGFPPFHGENDHVIFRKIKAGFDPTVKKGWGAWFPAQAPVSASARDLISKLLTIDPSVRLTAAEALAHPWMQGRDVPLHPLPVTVMSNLTTFIRKTQFSNEILEYLTQSSMDNAEYISLARTFRFIDKNNDGTLTVDEFKQALQETEAYGGLPNEAFLRNAIDFADLDGDGTISWKELLLATTARRLAAKEERMWNSFKKMDLDGDGKLSVAELQTALNKDDATIRRLIADVDKDNNGFVDYEEFLSIFEKQETENNKVIYE